MTKPLSSIIALLLLAAAVMTGQQAMATDKTVTYTISYTGTNTIVFTPNTAGFKVVVRPSPALPSANRALTSACSCMTTSRLSSTCITTATTTACTSAITASRLITPPPSTRAAGQGESKPVSYTFTAKTTDYASRFRLVFSANGDADGDNDTPFAYLSNANIIVNGEGTLQIVDVMGRIVVSIGGHTRCVPTAGMTPGVYVLRLIDGNIVRTQKIVIE